MQNNGMGIERISVHFLYVHLSEIENLNLTQGRQMVGMAHFAGMSNKNVQRKFE